MLGNWCPIWALLYPCSNRESRCSHRSFWLFMAFRYFVGLAGEKSFRLLTWTKPTRLSSLIKFALLQWAHGRQGEHYEISPPVPWQLKKQLMGRMWIIENSNISLCGFTLDSFIPASAWCPAYKWRACCNQVPPRQSLASTSTLNCPCQTSLGEGEKFWCKKKRGGIDLRMIYLSPE